MALQWSPKAASDVAERVWTPKAGEAVTSKTITVSTGTATVTSTIWGDQVVVLVTGGTAGVTQVIAASAVVDDETITETIYIPVIATTNALARTGQDIAADVMELVIGIGQTPEAGEAEFALRKLTEMLASWAVQGADMGIPLPVTTATVFYCPDAEIMAIKANLFNEIMPWFRTGWEPTPMQAKKARTGLSQIKTVRLPEERTPASDY